MDESPVNPAFALLGPRQPVHPVILAVPHAGRDYSAQLIAAARVPLATLRRLEDRRADLLISHAVASGYSAIVATAPRAAIDLNRAEHDIDPTALQDAPPGLRPSQRARGGLGVIPTELAGAGALWRAPLAMADYTHRITTIHRPYHAAIAQHLSAAYACHGGAVMLDIHSMPALSEPVDIIFGDRFGLTADSQLIDALMAGAEGAGFRAARNHPYAGAHAIERHARRSQGIDAVQVEVARPCYLDAGGGVNPAGVERCAALVAQLARIAHSYVGNRRQPAAIAAE